MAKDKQTPKESTKQELQDTLEAMEQQEQLEQECQHEDCECEDVKALEEAVIPQPLDWYSDKTEKVCLDGGIMTLQRGEKITDLYLAWRLRNAGIKLVNTPPTQE